MLGPGAGHSLADHIRWRRACNLSSVSTAAFSYAASGARSSSQVAPHSGRTSGGPGGGAGVLVDSDGLSPVRWLRPRHARGLSRLLNISYWFRTPTLRAICTISKAVPSLDPRLPVGQSQLPSELLPQRPTATTLAVNLNAYHPPGTSPGSRRMPRVLRGP